MNAKDATLNDSKLHEARDTLVSAARAFRGAYAEAQREANKINRRRERTEEQAEDEEDYDWEYGERYYLSAAEELAELAQVICGSEFKGKLAVLE
jgi:Sec-independent protein translocase protein TatA